MLAPAQLDSTAFAQQGFRFILKCGIAVMLLFCVASFVAFAQQPARVEALSAVADISFTLVLIGMYMLLGRLQLGIAALILAGTILIYCILNLLLFPNALIRVISQPMLAVILALAYINSRQLRALSVAAWITIVLIFWQSNYALISNEPIVDFIALCAVSAILLMVLSQFHARMSRSLTVIQEANAALHNQQTSLEAQVAERTTALQQALGELEGRAAEQQRLLTQTEQQRDAIRALSLPILPINQTTLAAPLIGTFDSQRLAELQKHVLGAIERSRARTLVLDITGVPTVDHEVALGLLRVAQAARLLGTRVVLAGIRPEVAQAIVSLGMDLASLDTTATFQDGIALAARRVTSDE
ncbi:MAG: STAS domain-containing protein [Roseiflexaceae bacterium]